MSGERDLKYMRMALEEGHAALAIKEVPVGCVVVHTPTDTVIGRGSNRTNVSLNVGCMVCCRALRRGRTRVSLRACRMQHPCLTSCLTVPGSARALPFPRPPLLAAPPTTRQATRHAELVAIDEIMFCSDGLYGEDVFGECEL